MRKAETGGIDVDQCRWHGRVKVAMMDQGVLAGIGNVFSDEILFQADIHPGAKAARLGDERLAGLHRALRHVLRVAI